MRDRELLSQVAGVDPFRGFNIPIVDWSVTWEAAAAIGQVASAVFAAAAAGLAAHATVATIQEQRRLRASEARASYYRRVIADPIIEEVNSFLEDALGVIDTAARRMADLVRKQTLYDDRRRELRTTHMPAFRTLHIKMMSHLTRRVDIWRDPTFRENTRRCAERIQDRVLQQFPKLIEPSDGARDVRAALQEETAVLLSALIESDPDIAAERQPPLSGP